MAVFYVWTGRLGMQATVLLFAGVSQVSAVGGTWCFRMAAVAGFVAQACGAAAHTCAHGSVMKHGCCLGVALRGWPRNFTGCE